MSIRLFNISPADIIETGSHINRIDIFYKPSLNGKEVQLYSTDNQFNSFWWNMDYRISDRTSEGFVVFKLYNRKNKLVKMVDYDLDKKDFYQEEYFKTCEYQKKYHLDLRGRVMNDYSAKVIKDKNGKKKWATCWAFVPATA